MVSFQNKNPNWGKLCRAIDWKMFIYFMAIWIILRTFGILYDHLVNFVLIWYIVPLLVPCTKKNLAILIRIFSGFQKKFLIGQSITEKKVNKVICAEISLFRDAINNQSDANGRTKCLHTYIHAKYRDS
jgi:hypothetical protein